jgi:hypothetical protein
MRLFSEKVVPTFTSSNLNILTVEDFQEIFFDVFEFEINGKKFIAEKVSEYKGAPVVDIPLVMEGKEYNALFVVHQGAFEVLFNKSSAVYKRDVDIESTLHIKESHEELEEIIFEKKEDILTEISQARQSAEKYAKKLKQQKINEAAQYFDEKKKALDNEINESKKGLLDEFLSLVENVKGEFFEFNEKEREKLSTFIESSISELADQLVESIEEKQDIAEERFNEQLNELATNILSGVLLKEISSNNDKSVKDINERFTLITRNLKTLLRSERDQIDENVNNKLTEFNDAIVSLEKTNIELNDQINKGDNRALSRIGNVKSQLEEAIDLSTNTLVARVDEAENKIRTFYDNKISLIEEKVVDLTTENKQYFIDLVNESKQSLLNEIANIKVDVPNIVIEKSNGKQEVDLKGIKSELEKIIGTRFSNELQSLKRLIEMSSGGGSVAKQFAAGGTMEGTLNVTGQYLSGGVDLLTIFGSGDDVAVNTVVRSSSANWNSAYNTSVVYQSNSATYSTIDYANSKFFPLTGGIISGATVINNNLTVNGNLTATGLTTFNNTVFSVTSALSVVHVGEGPAVWVGNSGLGDIASFNDIDTGVEVLHIGGSNGSFPNVGVKTSTPNVDFTVNGQISASNTIWSSGGNSNNWNSTYSTVSALSATWSLGPDDSNTIIGLSIFL